MAAQALEQGVRTVVGLQARQAPAVEFVEHRCECRAVAVESAEQQMLAHLGWGSGPAAAQRVVDGAFELPAQAEVAEWSAGAQVPADVAGVELVNGVGPELGLDVTADLVEVDAEGG
jgi:hypothetical protein